MISTSSLAKEKIWADKAKYDLAEKHYYEKLANVSPQAQKLKILIENMETVNINDKMDLAQNQKIGELDPELPESKVKVEEKISKPDLAPKKVPETKKIPDVKTKRDSPEKQGLQNTTKKDKNIDKVLPVPVQNTEVNTNDTQVEFELTIKCNSKKSKKPKKDKKKNLTKNNTNTNGITDTNTVIKNEINSQINAIVDNAKKGAPQSTNANTLAGEVAKAREHIKNSIQCIDKVTSMTVNAASPDTNKVEQLQKEQKELKQKVFDLTKIVNELVNRVAQLETKKSESTSKSSQHPPAQPAKQDDDADDGVDLFASDSEEEDAEAAKIKEQRLAEYAAKKSKKPVLIAKSNIILDVKPWDDETDMKVMEAEVRKITCDGLIWGASKLVPLAYGIHKLQISCVVEDDKVSVDWLTETIEEIQDYVQSVDIAAFNKV